MKNNIYLDRLVNEWQKYGKIIAAIDYDDTVSPWGFSKEQIKETRIFEILQVAQQTGAYISCFTACNPDRHEEIRNLFKENGIHLDSINENPVDLPYGHHGKMYANIYLDDRAGLTEALSILENATYRS